MTLAAGQLNCRCVIQQPGTGVDDWGQPVADAWVEVCQVWASIKHLSGLQAIKADATASVVRASIRIRYRLGLDAGMRVLHGGAVYNISAVLPDAARREFTDLVCELRA